METSTSLTTTATSEGTFCLHQVSLTESSEDDYQYEEVPTDDDFCLQEGDEDLAKALHTMQEQAVDAQIMAQWPGQAAKHSLSETPEVIDDFLCNFLIRMGMNRTLDCFQTEWYGAGVFCWTQKHIRRLQHK